MAENLSFTGSMDLMRNLQRIERPEHALVPAMVAFGSQIGERSLRLVPRDKANLAASFVQSAPEVRGGEIRVDLSYGGPAAPYALSVHENPRSGRTGGVSPSGKKYKSWSRVGQWKYLEQPFAEASWRGVAKEVDAWVRRAIR